MTLSNETLMAFVDGELAPAQMTDVERELRAHPELAAFVEVQRALRQELHASFENIMNAPLPAALRDAVEKTQPSWQWRFLHALRSLSTPRGLMWAGIPAAALACGVAIGIVMSGAASNALMGVRGGALMAKGDLARALNQQLASAQSNEGPQVGISFRDKNQKYCRTFTASNLAGVACRDAAGWNIAALAERSAEPAGTYGTAASSMPDLVRETVEGMIAGAPLDAAGERNARQNGWKSR